MRRVCQTYPSTSTTNFKIQRYVTSDGSFSRGRAVGGMFQSSNSLHTAPACTWAGARGGERKFLCSCKCISHCFIAARLSLTFGYCTSENGTSLCSCKKLEQTGFFHCEKQNKNKTRKTNKQIQTCPTAKMHLGPFLGTNPSLWSNRAQ